MDGLPYFFFQTLHLWVFPDVFKNADGSDWQNNSFAFRNSSGLFLVDKKGEKGCSETYL